MFYETMTKEQRVDVSSHRFTIKVEDGQFLCLIVRSLYKARYEHVLQKAKQGKIRAV